MISLSDMVCGAKLGNCLHGTTAAHHSTGQKGRPQVLGCHDAPVAALRLLPPRPPAPLQWHARLCHGTGPVAGPAWGQITLAVLEGVAS